MISLRKPLTLGTPTLGLLLAGIIVLAGCGYTAPASQAPTAPPVSGNTIDISGFAFSPAATTVPAGTTVTWTNRDSVGHTVTGNGFESNNLGRGDTFRHTFAEPGTFEYACAYHPGMKGTVTVTQ
jgi:plastocyanin